MTYLTARSAGRCVLLVLLAMHTGCTSPNRQARKTALPEVRAWQSGRVEHELQEDLSQFVDYAESEIGAVAAQIRTATQDVDVKEAALRWNVEFTQVTAKRSLQEKSMAHLMDGWAFAIRQANYLQSGEGKNLFGDQQSLAIEAAARIQKAIEAIARKYAADDELPEINRHIEAYARANPIRGVFAFEVPEAFSSGEEGQSMLSKILNAPWALTKSGRDVLDPTSSLAQSVDRINELMEDYPVLVRWQAQLLWLELERSTSFQTTMKGIEGFPQSLESLAATAESLPQQVRRELRLALDDIDAHQPELRKTLQQARETVDAANAAMASAETVSASIERSIDGVTRAGEVWQTTAEAVTNTFKQFEQLRNPRTPDESEPSGSGSTNSKRGEFDIAEYTQSAETLTKSTVELRNLLSEVRSFLSGETLEKDLARVVPLTKAAFAQTIADARGVVDHIAWRAVQLCGLVFLLALAYRFLAGRHAVRPPATS